MSVKNYEYGRAGLAYYRNHPGQDIHYKDVWESLAPEIVRDSKMDNLSTFMARTVERHPEWGFTRTGAGVYRFTPPENRPAEIKTPDMVEILGFMEDKSTMIVRDESGALSLWRKVDLPQ